MKHVKEKTKDEMLSMMTSKIGAEKALAMLSNMKDMMVKEKEAVMRKACTIMAEGQADKYEDCMARNKEKMM